MLMLMSFFRPLGSAPIDSTRSYEEYLKMTSFAWVEVFFRLLGVQTEFQRPTAWCRTPLLFWT